MQFSITAAFVTLIAAVSAADFPAKFELVADGGDVLLYKDSRLYVGIDTTANPIAKLTGGSGSISYTADDNTPTAWQNLYAVPKDVKPLGFTAPHSGALPEGAIMNEWGVTDDGYLSFQGDHTAFMKSAEQGFIAYGGLGHTGNAYTQVLISVKELK